MQKDKISNHFLFINLPIQLLGIIGLLSIFSGLIELKFIYFTLLGWVLISGIGISIGFHRLLSHKSFKVSKVTRNIITYLGCLGAQGSPIFWVAVHNGYHHASSDKQNDIHSPIHGFFNSYIGWQLFLNSKNVSFKSAVDLTKEPWMKFCHKYYLVIVWVTIITLSMISLKVTFTFLLIPMLISINQENCVNLFCHVKKLGYRNYNTNDNSVNIPILAYLTFGQAWHNNHHAHPKKYNFGGNSLIEFDPSVPIIKFILWLDTFIIHLDKKSN